MKRRQLLAAAVGELDAEEPGGAEEVALPQARGPGRRAARGAARASPPGAPASRRATSSALASCCAQAHVARVRMPRSARKRSSGLACCPRSRAASRRRGHHASFATTAPSSRSEWPGGILGRRLHHEVRAVVERAEEHARGPGVVVDHGGAALARHAAIAGKSCTSKVMRAGALQVHGARVGPHQLRDAGADERIVVASSPPRSA